LKKEKQGKWNVVKLLSEMMARISPDSNQEVLCHLKCRVAKQFENLEIPFSRSDPAFHTDFVGDTDLFRKCLSVKDVERITGLSGVTMQETVKQANVEPYTGPGSCNRRAEEANAKILSAKGASLEILCNESWKLHSSISASA
jgi:hypothetical protein